MHPYEINDALEEELCKYTGAPFCVLVNSCTSALFLCCKYLQVSTVVLPTHTYVGVPMSVINAGGKCKFLPFEWLQLGHYMLVPYPIIDSARVIYRNMFDDLIRIYSLANNAFICLSFQAYKHIPIGEGGAILTNNSQAVPILRKMRNDGRTDKVEAKDDIFDTLGFHMWMSPDDAARGLHLIQKIKDNYEPLDEPNYTDLSQVELFK